MSVASNVPDACLLTFFDAYILKWIPFQLSTIFKLQPSVAWMVDFQTYQKALFLINQEIKAQQSGRCRPETLLS